MKKRKRKNLNVVARPVHPGRQIYTAILGAKTSIGEIAGVMGCSRVQLVKILQGKARLTARYAFLLAEMFTWDRALRWYMMQSKCDMYLAAVKERRARRALMNEDGHEYDTDKWAEDVAQAWEDTELENDPMSRVDPTKGIKYKDLTMEEEVNG